MRSFATILLALSLPLHAFAAHGVNLRRHADIALHPRQQEFQNAALTFYDITTGTTACGGNYAASDFVVALNAAQFGDTPGSSQYCGASITITCNGKTSPAFVVDKCPGCRGVNGLDLTEGLFESFAPLSVGVLTCEWSFGGAAPAPTTSSTPPPSPTTHYVPPTTSQQPTSSPPPPSSSSTSTSTSTTSKTSSSVSSAVPTTTPRPSSTSSPTQTSSGASYNNPPASSLAQPSGTISPGQNQSINSMYEAIIGLGTLVEALNS
ncbi:hypothetical protein F5888DRAFT_1832586 [Russula emetica]|nr:hypothetical protein F5888DRAFT_1832586 [Russula emetica]